MSRHLAVRIAIVAVVVAVSLWYLYPFGKTINLGLDLQGGIHLVLGVDVDKALEAHVERAGDTVRAELQKKGIVVSRTERRGVGELVVQLASGQNWDTALQTVGDVLPAFDRKEADQGAGRITLTLKPREANEIRTLAVRQGLETIRNRIDQFGVSEASIQQQGENRILVQLPGVQDPARAKALIGKTALLEFKLVDPGVDAIQAADTKQVPVGDVLVYSTDTPPIPYVLKDQVLVSGENLVDAQPFDDQGVYFQVTRGVAKRDHAFPKGGEPTVFMMANPLVNPPAAQVEKGAAAVSAPDNRWLRCDIKSISLIGNVLLRQLSAEAGAAETILFRDGKLTEASASNVFVVKRGVIFAPPKSKLILPGITYDVVTELARANGLPLELREVDEKEVRGADELWVTSSSKEVLAIVSLDGARVGEGRPGPVFARMYQLYQEFKQKVMRAGKREAVSA